MDKGTLLQLESLREALHTSLEKLRTMRFENGDLKEFSAQTIIDEINILRKRFDDIEANLKK